MKVCLFRNRCLVGVATLTLALVPMGLSAAPKVLMPTGDANAVLILDSSVDRVAGEIEGVENSHGLAAGAAGTMALAGSLNIREQGDMPKKPAGMSDDEHSAHHGAQSAGTVVEAASVGTVYQIDTAQNRILKQIDVPGVVHHTLITPDGRYGIATHPATGGISTIDMESGKLIGHIATGPVPNYAVANADGTRVWVSNTGNNTVSEVDTRSWIVHRNLAVGQAPEHMVLSPDESSLYVVDNGEGIVTELDVASGETIRRFAVGNDPHGIDVSDDGTQLYVSVKGENKLVAIQLHNGTIRTLPLSPAPYHLTTVTDTGKLYVSSRKQSKIWVVSQRELQLLGEIPIRGTGHQMVVLEER